MDINIQNIVADLRCPITMDWLDDPVRVPCCQKAFSRTSVEQWFINNNTCPTCSHGFSVEIKNSILNAPTDTIISSLVESARSSTDLRALPTQQHHWSAQFVPIRETHNTGRLTLELKNSRFVVRSSLFIAVVDKSGSMCGSPINQVKTALKHILGLSQNQTNVKTVLIVYDSMSKVLPFTEQEINYISGGSGTNFRGAFNILKQVLSGYICSDKPEDKDKVNNVGSVSVAFMTDGEDGGNRSTLVKDFKEVLEDIWTSKERDITVHAIGFGSGCDKVLLENLRTAGTIEGTFRYTEPSDGEDSLCQKITGVYDICSKGSTKTVSVSVGERVYELQIPINERGNGCVSMWLEDHPRSVMINSSEDTDVNVIVETDNRPLLIDRTLKQYVSTRIDKLASDLVLLNEQRSSLNLDILVFQCALLAHLVDDLRSWCDPDDYERIDFISGQIKAFSTGNALNLGQLNDMKFTSLFARVKPNHKGTDVTACLTRTLGQTLALDNVAAFEHSLTLYSRLNTGKNRNLIQSDIMMQPYDNEVPLAVQNANIQDLLYKDINGNTALMLAAYCGHSKIVHYILDRHATSLDLNQVNNDNETALTLAIKKRGFDKTINLLLEYGCTIPTARKKGLERYAIDNKFNRTAKIIANLGDGGLSLDMDDSMKPEYIRYLYARAITSPDFEKYRDSYFSVMLSKGPTELKDLIEDLLERGVIPTIKHLNEYCMPKKPDAVDIPEYLELAKLLVKYRIELISDVDDEEESALYTSVKKGSLPHVKYFIEQGSKIDQPNKRIATPLWCACYRRYPCIITELLNHGADITWENENKNIPMYGACERGSRKIIELLISRGSPVEHINKNGDTHILIACRNGQSESLECLLEYVSEEYVRRIAHIDGFNCVMAAAEAGHGNCIKVLSDYGMDLEVKTSTIDVKVLGGATALHIAAYYGRVGAIVELIKCGANPNSQAMHGETPLHLAIVQGYVDAIKALRDVSDLTITDAAGNTAAAYCRDRKDIRDLLINPALDIFMKLARGGFQEEDSKTALKILRKHKGVFSSNQFLDIRDHNGVTPLLEASLHNNREVAETLLEMGASAEMNDRLGMYPLTWAKHNMNARLADKLIKAGASEAFVMDQLKILGKLTSYEKSILFLGKPPVYSDQIEKSGIVERMNQTPDARSPANTTSFPKDLLRLECSKTAIEDFFQQKTEIQPITPLLWYAKAFTTAVTATGCYLSPVHTLAIAMYTNNPVVSRVINESALAQSYESDIVKNYIGTLYTGLNKLPEYQGEVFIGTSLQVNRRNYMVGKEFTWGQFVSASTLWRVAMEGTPSYTSKNRRGVIFAVKTRTARLVGQYSQFSFDSEAILLPYKKYRVYDWFHGDPIALGQPNIREHSFHVLDESESWMNTEQMANSDKALIIAIEELEDM